jgi:hypothetical protein
MRNTLALKAAVLTSILLFATVARANIQYYGYVTEDVSGSMEKYTNFAHVGYSVNASFRQNADTAISVSSHGLLLFMDVGGLLFSSETAYRRLLTSLPADWDVERDGFCFKLPWQCAFDRYIEAFGDVRSRIVAIAPRDEPWGTGANLDDVEAAAAYVKAAMPAVNTYLIEGGSAVGTAVADSHTPAHIDWIGMDYYRIHPTNPLFLNAWNALAGKFAGRQHVYVVDAYWDDAHMAAYGAGVEVLAQVTQEYYDLARSDPDAIVLGLFLWGGNPDDSRGYGAPSFPCSVRAAHARIGREILGRFGVGGHVYGFDQTSPNGCLTGYAGISSSNECELPLVQSCVGNSCSYAQVASWPILDSQTQSWVHGFSFCPGRSIEGSSTYTYAIEPQFRSSALLYSDCREDPACVLYPNTHQPIGYLDGIDANGYASGWTCDPDSPSTSTDVRFRVDSPTSGMFMIGPYRTNQGSEQAVANLCGGGYVHRFRVYLPRNTKGALIYAYGQDLTSGQANLPGWQCAATWPACRW